jgi:Zn-dependent protease with chaperone function
MSNSSAIIPKPRVALPQISPLAWEHPADRAALNTLRAIPAVDDILKKIYGYFGERGIRLLFQANAVRVGPKQFPRLDRMMDEVCATLDWPTRPELYVSQSPEANAGAFGMERPFIVLQSGVVQLLDDDELQVVLGHELGHIMSEHMLYRTVAIMLLRVGLHSLPALAGIALQPIRYALLEWMRKSELSCDRAGLLATQAPATAMRNFLKMAGGGAADEMDVDAFMAQAREYMDSESTADFFGKILVLLDRTHPFNTLRAAHLQRWIEEGHYDRIVRGEYPKRGSQDAKAGLRTDFSDTKNYYAEHAREAATTVADAARRARDAVVDMFSGRKKEE